MSERRSIRLTVDEIAVLFVHALADEDYEHADELAELALTRNDEAAAREEEEA